MNRWLYVTKLVIIYVIMCLLGDNMKFDRINIILYRREGFKTTKPLVNIHMSDPLVGVSVALILTWGRGMGPALSKGH